MDSTLTAVIVGLIPTLVAGAFAARQTRRLARVNFDLETERKLKDREMNAEDVLTKYREPLAAAAFDLQSRCYNILELDFFGKFGEEHERFRDAQMTTLFRFAQYFGWTEILRRDIQFLSFPELDDTRDVAKLQKRIADRFATSANDEPLMIWVDEQRAIGERMIVEDQGKLRCMGYAAFCDVYHECFETLFKRVFDDVAAPSTAPRYRGVQHGLSDLVALLDPKHLRYAEDELGHA